MQIKKSLKSYLNSDKKAQVFLVCTVIITIYMLSFITIIYELNVNQYSRQAEITEFQAAYENFKTETDNFIFGMIANYSSVVTIIDSNATANTYLQNWLDFAEGQLFETGYFAVFEINNLIVAKGNGYVSITADIDLFMECNYMTIDTQLLYSYRYTITYTNTAIEAIINFYYDTNLETNFIGYATVTVNAVATTTFYNGTYTYAAPLVGGDIVQGITNDQILVILTV